MLCEHAIKDEVFALGAVPFFLGSSWSILVAVGLLELRALDSSSADMIIGIVFVLCCVYVTVRARRRGWLLMVVNA